MTEVHVPSVSRAITIDARQSRDLDDAFWVDRTENGWTATVCIADVAAAVPPGSKDDVDAMAQAETVYHARGNAPMLPRHLAEDSLSLLPGRQRGVLSVQMEFAIDGSPRGPARVSVAFVTSQARLAHEDVRTALSDRTNSLHLMLTEASALAASLLARRQSSGALAAYDLHRGWATAEDGVIVYVGPEASVGHMIVQELMVATNASVARWAIEQDLPIPFRNHAPAAAAPSGRAALLADINLAIRSLVPSSDVRERLIMLLGRASYSHELLGHFGLSLAAYTHFTSPIRRYADLVAHRQVRAAALGLPPPYELHDIARITGSLNAVLRDRRAAEKVHYRAAAEREAERAASAGMLDSAPDAVFERAIKVDVARGEPSLALSAAFRERCSRGDLPVGCMTILFTRTARQAVWSPLHAVALASLDARPHDAVSVLAAAPGAASDWPGATYEISGQGPFVAVARAGTFASQPRFASTKKLALQLAAVSLLRSMNGLPEPEVSAVAVPTPRVDVPMPDLVDPVSSLQTWCARRGIAPPCYEFRMSGPAHKPHIDATVEADGRKALGTGSSKGAAKRAAAESLVARLRSESSS